MVASKLETPLTSPLIHLVRQLEGTWGDAERDGFPKHQPQVGDEGRLARDGQESRNDGNHLTCRLKYVHREQ